MHSKNDLRYMVALVAGCSDWFLSDDGVSGFLVRPSPL